MKSVGGIHRTRLAASKVHRHLVNEARRTVQKLGWQVPEERHFANACRRYPTPVSGTRLVRDCFRLQGKSTVRTVRIHSRFPSIWVQRRGRRFAFGR